MSRAMFEKMECPRCYKYILLKDGMPACCPFCGLILGMECSIRRLIDFLEVCDCGDNSCRFGGEGKGGMRTNGGCRCLSGLPSQLKHDITKWWWEKNKEDK